MTGGVPWAFLDPRGATAHGIRTENPEGAQTKEGRRDHIVPRVRHGAELACLETLKPEELTQTVAVNRGYLIVDDAQ
jgi:hypothetical protein